MLQQSHVPLTNGIMSFLQASEDYDLAPIGIGSMHEQAQKLAEFGRHGDIYFVHAAEGETVIPLEVLNANPKVKDMLFNQMREMGLDPDEFVVGNELNSINPVTGMPEFFFSSVWRGAKRAASSVWQGVRKAAPYVVPLVLSIYGVPGAAPGSMFGAGSFGAAFLGGGVGSLMAGKSMKESLRNAAIAGGTSALVRGVSNINKPGGFPGGVGRSFGVGEGGFSVYGDPYESGADVDWWGRRTTPTTSDVSAFGDMSYGPPPPKITPAQQALHTGYERGAAERVALGGGRRPGTQVAQFVQPTGRSPAWPYPAGRPKIGANYMGADFTSAYLPETWRAGPYARTLPPIGGKVPDPSTTVWQDIKKGADVASEKLGDIAFRLGETKANVLNTQLDAGKAAVDAAKARNITDQRALGRIFNNAYEEAGPGPFAEYGPTLAAGYGLYKLLGDKDKDKRQRDIDEKEAAAERAYKASYAIYGEDPGKYYVDLGLPPTALVAQGGLAEYPRRDLLVEGQGTERSDDIPAMLSDGEFVMNAESVRGADPSGRGNRYAGANNLYNMMRNFEMRT